ncbi:hypothetical protein LCGC14_1027270 [marine sediment metagenome]|uniref:Uncharacterized protein n=1 Tax=marine sediment metagenome TaxID=412755 RepID=A0A0F9NHI2_9ZZZZ
MSIKKRFGISEAQLEIIIMDFLAHLRINNLDIIDADDDSRGFCDGDIIEYYINSLKDK